MGGNARTGEDVRGRAMRPVRRVRSKGAVIVSVARKIAGRAEALRRWIRAWELEGGGGAEAVAHPGQRVRDGGRRRAGRDPVQAFDSSAGTARAWVRTRGWVSATDASGGRIGGRPAPSPRWLRAQPFVAMPAGAFGRLRRDGGGAKLNDMRVRYLQKACLVLGVVSLTSGCSGDDGGTGGSTTGTTGTSGSSTGTGTTRGSTTTGTTTGSTGPSTGTTGATDTGTTGTADTGTAGSGSTTGGVDCTVLDVEACATEPACAVIHGRPYEELGDPWCLGAEVPLGCHPADEVCAEVETTACEGGNGAPYLFPNSCIPTGWSPCDAPGDLLPPC